jgi:hypothetical protein
MGFVIAYVVPKDGPAGTEPIAWTARRGALGDQSIIGPGWPDLERQLALVGYDVRIGDVPPPASDWPFTCVAYTSKNREGQGRTGSAVYRFHCRKIPRVGRRTA